MLEAHVKSVQRTTLVLYAALVMSVFMYVGVAFLILQPGAADPAPTADTVKLALMLAAGVTGGMSVMLPRFLLSETRVRALMREPIDTERLARDPQGNENTARLHALQALDATSQRLMLLSQRWMPTTILGLALAESVAVFGLVVALLTKDPRQIVPFAGAALALMASHFPRLPAFVERAREWLQRP